MKFALNDEQAALQDATRDFLTSRCTSDGVRNAMVSERGYDLDLYHALCGELGLASLIIAEDLGGFGASDVELAVVAEQMGYFLASTPLRTHIGAQIAVMECAIAYKRSEHLAQLVSGEEIATIIYADEVARDFGTELAVDMESGGVVLSATFEQVLFALDAKHLYFFVGVGDSADLVYVDLQQDGVVRSVVPSLDQTIPLTKIVLTGVFAQVISDDETKTRYGRARSRSIIAATNEMVGSTQAVLDMSVAYAKDRFQFGRAIGSFQSIKHKCADMLLESESARSIALFGAWLASQPAGFTSDDLEDDLDHIASMAKYYCSHALSHAAGENIQIHGGIGFTFEHDAQLYFKRAAFMNAHLGLPREHAVMLSEDLINRQY